MEEIPAVSEESSEIWRIVPGFSNYAVSNKGNAKNVITGRLFVLSKNIDGYRKVTLFRDKKQHAKLVHCLVALCFLEPPSDPEEIYTVDHINRVRDDNRVENLRWATFKEQRNNCGSHNFKNRCRQVLKIDETTGETLQIYDSVQEAADDMEINYANISRACSKNGELHGYVWKYADSIEQEGEVWENISEKKDVARGAVEVSNFGRVRLSSGRISRTKSGAYPRVDLDKKKTAIHRLVAKTFLDPPDEDSKNTVNHKDRNKHNPALENLEWASRSDQQLHVVRTGGKKSLCRPVKQFTLDGQLVKEFDSIKSAVRETGFPHSGIVTVCRKMQKTTHGFIFKYSDEDRVNYEQLPISKKPHSKKRPIIQLSMNGNEILAEYESINDAGRKLGLNSRGIGNALTGKNKSAHGFKWKYKDITGFGETYSFKSPVVQMTLEGELIMVHDSVLSASKKVGCSRNAIMKVIRGHKTSHWGFKWKYHDPLIQKNDNVSDQASPLKKLKISQ
jgi:hypothetical protein